MKYIKNEIWKDVLGFESLYQISNFGNVKSLNYRKKGIEQVLIARVNPNGYCVVSLWLNNKSKMKKVHQLVAIAFLNHTPCGMELVVNHKDFDRTNNHIDNLEIVTGRENGNRKHLKSTSIYTGVSKSKNSNSWVAQIKKDNKKIYLGSFKNEIDAHNAYENYLKSIDK